MGREAAARSGLVVGIDATNLRAGGSLTHLRHMLRAADPQACGVSGVVVWGGRETLAVLEERPWLTTENPAGLDGGIVRRTHWQRLRLSRAARDAGCDVLFVPGGSYAGDFRPVVTMSRNMLPFEWRELRRYGVSARSLKFALLRVVLQRSFTRSDGVIFLTQYARRQVQSQVGSLGGRNVIIPHGLESRFYKAPRAQKPIEEYSEHSPYRILYVSTVDQYKHPWHVVDAVAQVRRRTQWPLALDLVGTAYPPALRRLKAALGQFDPAASWATYHGELPHADLHRIYSEADLGVFASSCENMPNILLECMAAGLPVACSGRGPMPEILGDGGVYFDPESPAETADALMRMIGSPQLRTEKAAASFAAAKKYSWRWCADETFGFLAGVARHHRR
jgi:glycosyltransferase involved in cell wall biosynthesis